MKIKLHVLFFIIGFTLLLGCATYKTQYRDPNVNKTASTKIIEHRFYLIGDAGNSPMGTKSEALKAFEIAISQAQKNSTAIFLGDNIYPKGMPKKNSESYPFAKHQLDVQIDAVKNFKGKTIFIPGNHDWYSDGLKGLKRQEDYIKDTLGKNTFLPENGCPIENETISENIELIIIDAKWYMTNWDKHPTINDHCDIKTRERFLDELESRIKKARGKTTLIAIHHPMFTNGSHGGQYDFKSHMKPLPILGTLKNVLRKTTGISPEDIQNKRYNEFRKHIITLAQENDRVVFVSGHDHNLQYIIQDNITQIISGSGSKSTPTRNVGSGLFSSSANGFVQLDIFKDGSSEVTFINAKNNDILYRKEIFPVQEQKTHIYSDTFSQITEASVYTKEETKKNGFYKFLWGKRFSEEYSTPVKVKTVMLDTLFGGLTPVRKGGGTQSNSLRLKDKKGREYVMRGLRKNALNYIQAFLFKEQYVEGQFNKTATEDLIAHVFSGSYPYASFVTATLSDPIGVLHTNPTLYYVPHQKAIEPYNDTFGDELYMIEEHTGDNHGDKANFAYSDELIGTDDMLKDIRSDESISIDEKAYIRSRLFDMLIGDWDRHQDQWRWAKTKKDGKTIYQPVPRDRDQVFSNMSDGILLGLGSSLIPAARLLKGYDGDLRSPKWFNFEPYPLDMALISNSDRSVWNAQVNRIVTNLTNEVIEDAFEFIPKELNKETITNIKQKLKERRSNLQKISDNYYEVINKTAVVKGSDKDDWFDIKRLPNGETQIIIYRIKDGGKKEQFYKRKYSNTETKEIWLYALDDDDVIHVHGNGDNLIKLRLIGGQNNDIYNIENGKKAHIYDYKSKKNTFKTKKGNKHLTDDYNINTYTYKKFKYNSNQLLPLLGFNPDDGIKYGLTNTYTVNKFNRNPFTAQHKFSASYYAATSGFDLLYNAEIANIFGKLNLGIDAVFTSPNYSVNFFGFGNETTNPNAENDDDFSLDFNRVKLSTLKIAPSLIWKGKLGAQWKFIFSYESIEVEETNNRFINQYFTSNSIENSNNFGGIEATYNFENKNNSAFPSLGFQTKLQIGYKTNLNNSNMFGYIIPELGFDYQLEPTGKLVLATNLKSHLSIGNDMEFYQAASLGASDGLRGYRNQRFTGKNAFYQLTDVRYMFNKLQTGILPINLGLYCGYDYGRVWLENNASNIWHNSYGGGFLVIAAEMFTGDISLFNSDEGLRFAFGVGLKF